MYQNRVRTMYLGQAINFIEDKSSFIKLLHFVLDKQGRALQERLNKSANFLRSLASFVFTTVWFGCKLQV